jgi:peptidoglycan/LPS O-acetylase OafA/YrhL
VNAPRPLLSRPQLLLLLAGLGFAIALAPQWVVPRYGFGAYLGLIALVVIALAASARPTRRR